RQLWPGRVVQITTVSFLSGSELVPCGHSSAEIESPRGMASTGAVSILPATNIGTASLGTTLGATTETGISTPTITIPAFSAAPVSRSGVGGTTPTIMITARTEVIPTATTAAVITGATATIITETATATTTDIATVTRTITTKKLPSCSAGSRTPVIIAAR